MIPNWLKGRKNEDHQLWWLNMVSLVLTWLQCASDWFWTRIGFAPADAPTEELETTDAESAFMPETAPETAPNHLTLSEFDLRASIPEMRTSSLSDDEWIVMKKIQVFFRNAFQRGDLLAVWTGQLLLVQTSANFPTRKQAADIEPWLKHVTICDSSGNVLPYSALTIQNVDGKTVFVVTPAGNSIPDAVQLKIVLPDDHESWKFVTPGLTVQRQMLTQVCAEA